MENGLVTPDLLQEEREEFASYHKDVKEEEEIWCLKYQRIMLKDGFMNTISFKSKKKNQVWKNNIKELVERGIQILYFVSLKEEAVHYFNNLLETQSVVALK